MNKIVVLVKNNFTNDRRVHNTALSLSKYNNKIQIIALKTYRQLPSKEYNIYKIRRIPIFSTIYSKQLQQIERLKKSSKKKNPIIALIKNNKLRISIIAFLNSLFYDVGSLFWTLINNPKIIWANDLNTLGIGFLAAKICNAKLIYDSHEIFTEGNSFASYTSIGKKILRKIEEKIIKKADVVIVTTNYRKNYLEKKYNIEDINVVMNCYNYIDIDKTDLFREEFLISNNKTIFLYQGLIHRKRGIFMLVDAILECENAVLIFMGNGSDKGNLYDYIVKKNCSNKVFIKDAVPMNEIIKYTSSADVGFQLLQNSGINHYSTISNKVFEYIMAEIPIIASDFPELRKLIVNNEIGFVVNQDDKTEIVKVITNIIEDNEKRIKFMENIKKVKHQYTWENEEKKIERIINEVCN